MKKFRSNLAIAALVLGAGAAFAFTTPAKHATVDPFWNYDGGTTTAPGSYSELPGSPACSGSRNICAIQAPEDPNNPGQPLISSALSSRIAAKDATAGDVFLKQ